MEANTMSEKEQALMEARHQARRDEKKMIQQLSSKEFDDLVYKRWNDYRETVTHSEDSIPFMEFRDEQISYYGRD